VEGSTVAAILTALFHILHNHRKSPTPRGLPHSLSTPTVQYRAHLRGHPRPRARLSTHTHTHTPHRHTAHVAVDSHVQFSSLTMYSLRAVLFVALSGKLFSFQRQLCSAPPYHRASPRLPPLMQACMRCCACFLRVRSREQEFFLSLHVQSWPSRPSTHSPSCASPCTPAASTVSSQLAISGITSVNLGATNATATFTVTPAITVQHAISVSS
jgi:hypothetical protein